MIDFMANGQAWVESMRKQFFSTQRSILFTYEDSGTSVELMPFGVTIGRYPETIDTDNNRSYTDVEVRHWIIPVEALSRMPRNGDSIQETQGDTVYTFEGTGFGGRPAGVWHDSERTSYRFNTIQVCVDDVENDICLVLMDKDGLAITDKNGVGIIGGCVDLECVALTDKNGIALTDNNGVAIRGMCIDLELLALVDNNGLGITDNNSVAIVV